MTEEQKTREARAERHAYQELPMGGGAWNAIRLAYLKGAEEERAAAEEEIQGYRDDYFLTAEEHDALAEKVEKCQRHIAELGSLSLEREEELRALREALQKIANKKTCEELHPGCEKYRNHEQGWEGVAEYAAKILREAGGAEA